MKTRYLLRFVMYWLVLSALAACSPAESPSIRLLTPVAADGSMGPNLVRSADGTIVLSWLEPAGDGHALRFAGLSDGTWSAPRTVASGDNWFVNWADFPSVVPISDSLWAAHWLESQPAGGYAYDVRTSVSRDGGASWSTSIIPHTDNTDTEHGFVTLFPSAGRVGMVWLDGRKMVNEFDDNNTRASAMTLRAARVDADLAVSDEALVDDMTCDCCQTDVTVTPDGPVLVYRDRTEDEVRDIYVSRQVDGEWQPGVPVGRDNWEIAACPVNGPVIQSTGSTVAVAWFTGAAGIASVKIAWSEDSGKTFSAPIDVAVEKPLGHVGAVLLADGDLVVTSLRAIGQGRATLALSRISRAGATVTHFPLPEAQNIFAFSVPQLSREGDNLVVAWTTENEGVFGVASALVPVSLLN